MLMTEAHHDDGIDGIPTVVDPPNSSRQFGNWRVFGPSRPTFAAKIGMQKRKCHGRKQQTNERDQRPST